MCKVFFTNLPSPGMAAGPSDGVHATPNWNVFFLDKFEYIIFIYLVYFIWLPPTEEAKYEVNMWGTMQGEGRWGVEQGKLLMCE